MTILRQGHIWWADLPEPVGRHPVMILTRTHALSVLTNVTAVLITSRQRGVDTEVLLGTGHGLEHQSVANFNNILTFSKELLDSYIGEVDAITLQLCFDAIRVAFDMP